MICVHKLKGEPVWVNPDQIIFIEGSHQSVITLLDGNHFVSSDSPEEIAAAVRHHRALILAEATELSRPGDGSTGRHLRSVPGTEV